MIRIYAKLKSIRDRCSECLQCVDVCDQQAVNTENLSIIKARCIGCGKCADACNFDAIMFYTRKIDINGVLPGCIEAGAENIELHAVVPDDEQVVHDWKIITNLVSKNYVSMCIDRSQLSTNHLIERIRAGKGNCWGEVNYPS